MAVSVPNSSVSTFSPEQYSNKSESLWLRPTVSYETVELENKLKVHNVGYANYIGYDSNIINLRNDWDVIYTFFIGYSGSRQKYKKEIIIQNGGQIGISTSFLKDNYYISIALNTGASYANTSTDNKKINFSMLNSSLAIKSGYNFHLADKRTTIQPNILIAYLLVDTLGYVNEKNVNVNSNIVHSLQIIPGVKAYINLENGLQPYVGIQFVENIINKNDFSANDVSVGEISVKPYIQYGAGLQKEILNNYSAYIQTTIRNGGRNGIILSVGLRKYF